MALSKPLITLLTRSIFFLSLRMPKRYDLMPNEEFSGDEAEVIAGYASESEVESEELSDHEIQERHREALLLPKISIYDRFAVPVPVNNPPIEYVQRWEIVPRVFVQDEEKDLPEWGKRRRKKKKTTPTLSAKDVFAVDDHIPAPPKTWADVGSSRIDLRDIMKETEKENAEKRIHPSPEPRQPSLRRPAAGGHSPAPRQPSLLRPAAARDDRSPATRQPSLLRPAAGGRSPAPRQPSLLRPAVRDDAPAPRQPSLLRPAAGGRSPAPRQPPITTERNRSNPDMLCNQQKGHDPDCPMSHSLAEWKPRVCRFDGLCRRHAVCLSQHSQEDKPGYLRRLVGITSSYFGRHADDFRRLYM